MPDLPLRVDLVNLAADELRARSAQRPDGAKIDPSQVFTPGSDVNLVVNGGSAMAEEVLRQLAVRINALFLDGAKGEDLDRLVADRFSPTIVRKQATPAIGPVYVTRSSGARPAGVIPQNTRVKTNQNVEFLTQADLPIPAGLDGPFIVQTQAVNAGRAGNAPALAVNQFSVPPFDTNLQVSNPEPMAGGDERELDDSLRNRARQFYLFARRGTIVAIENGALTVQGVRLATAVELTNPDGSLSGHVALYISDAAGNGNAALVNAVRAAELEYRAAGVILDISASQPLFVSIGYRLRFTAAANTANAFDQVRLATVARVNALAPNQTLERSMLYAIARQVQGVVVLNDAVVEPVGDLVPAPGQVLRTRLDLVYQVAP